MGRKRKSNPVGRWANYSSTSIDGFEDAVEEILREYGDVVYEATEDGITAAAYVLQSELKQATPNIKKPPKGYQKKNFAKRWKVIGVGKYKMTRYVGNTTTVKGKNGEPISLTNIFEYSTTLGNPFVEETYSKSINKMAAACVAEIKKEV